MAIEGITGAVMTQQVPKVEPVKMDKVEVDASLETQQQAVQQNISVSARKQGYDQKDGQGKNSKGQDEGKDIQDVSPEKVKSALADINKKIAPTHTQCEFKYHEKTHRISITVRNSDTDEVIKEIPPEKTLDMIAKSLELAGILVDEKR